MARKKQKGNGAGTVYPRKNKQGKVIGYRGSYFDPEGKRRYVSAKTKTEAEKALRQAMADADRGLIFVSEVGEPLDRRYITSHRFKPLLKRAGLPHFRFHDLRHTCAALLLSKNVNPKIVSEMLGHATIAITLDTSSHVLPNMQDSAAEAIEEVLS